MSKIKEYEDYLEYRTNFNELFVMEFILKSYTIKYFEFKKEIKLWKVLHQNEFDIKIKKECDRLITNIEPTFIENHSIQYLEIYNRNKKKDFKDILVFIIKYYTKVFVLNNPSFKEINDFALSLRYRGVDQDKDHYYQLIRMDFESKFSKEENPFSLITKKEEELNKLITYFSKDGIELNEIDINEKTIKYIKEELNEFKPFIEYNRAIKALFEFEELLFNLLRLIYLKHHYLEISSVVQVEEGNTTKNIIENLLIEYLESKVLSENEFAKLVDLLLDFFNNNTAKKTTTINVKKVGKKRFGWTLNQIYRQVYSNNEKLSYQYISLICQNISIFSKDSVEENSYLRSNLYKYLTSKTQ